MKPWMQRVGAWLLAVLVAGAVGSVIHTQRILAELSALGAQASFGLRLQTTAQDLLGFGPTWTALVAAGFLIALPVAALLARWRPAWRGFLFPLAGAVAVVTALVLMRQLLGLMPVAAARDSLGLLLFAFAGALGGAVYAWRTRTPL